MNIKYLNIIFNYNTMKTCVYSRFVFDLPYLNYWIEHYLNLEFDYIVILFFEYKYKGILNIKEELIIDNILDGKFNTDNIIIKNINSSYNMNLLYDIYKGTIPVDIDYILICDSDEYLIINDKYKSITNLINYYYKKTPFIFDNNLINLINDNYKSVYKNKSDKFQYYKNNTVLGIQWTWNTNSLNFKDKFIDNIKNNIYMGKCGPKTIFSTEDENGIIKLNRVLEKNNITLENINSNYKTSYKNIIDISKNKNVNYKIHSISNIICDINDVQLLHFRHRGLFNIIFKNMHNSNLIKGCGLKGSEVCNLKSNTFTTFFNNILNYENIENIKHYILDQENYEYGISKDISQNILNNFKNSIKLLTVTKNDKTLLSHYIKWIVYRLKITNVDNKYHNYLDEDIKKFI